MKGKRIFLFVNTIVSLIILMTGIAVAQSGDRDITCDFNLEQLNSRYYKLNFENILPTIKNDYTNKISSVRFLVVGDSSYDPSAHNWLVLNDNAEFSFHIDLNDPTPNRYTITASDNNENSIYMENQFGHTGYTTTNVIVDSEYSATAVSSDISCRGDARLFNVSIPISFNAGYSGTKYLHYKITDTSDETYTGTAVINVGTQSYTPTLSYQTISGLNSGYLDFFNFKVSRTCGASSLKYLDFKFVKNGASSEESNNSVIGRYYVPRKLLAGYNYSLNDFSPLGSANYIGVASLIGDTTANYAAVWHGSRDNSLVKENDLDVNLKITFNHQHPAIRGLYNVYIRTTDIDNSVTGWTNVGSYTVTSPTPGEAVLLARTGTKEAVWDGAKWRLSTDSANVARPLGIPYSGTPGSTSIEFLESEKYYPKYSNKTLNLISGYTVDAVTDYFKKGNLKVMLKNISLDQGGWRIQGETEWRENGTIVYLKQGTYTIEFKPEAGFQTPLSISVYVSRGASVTKNITYQ